MTSLWNDDRGRSDVIIEKLMIKGLIHIHSVRPNSKISIDEIDPIFYFTHVRIFFNI